jgi:uracil-DNA glycosylase
MSYSDGLYEYTLSHPLTGWESFFESQRETLRAISKALQGDDSIIYPPLPRVFRALKVRRPKVVIIGQDPYHNGTATGLCFSYPSKTKPAYSLKNIYKKLESEGFHVDHSQGSLRKWVREGVLLLNTALTVRQGQANSHAKLWRPFTHALVRYLSDTMEFCVFILWGNHAKRFMFDRIIDPTKHKVITGAHPSPFSARKFFEGRDYFIEANDALVQGGLTPINWNL